MSPFGLCQPLELSLRRARDMAARQLRVQRRGTAAAAAALPATTALTGAAAQRMPGWPSHTVRLPAHEPPEAPCERQDLLLAQQLCEPQSLSGAEAGSRTPTGVSPLSPEPSASASSATSAPVPRIVWHPPARVKRRPTSAVTVKSGWLPVGRACRTSAAGGRAHARRRVSACGGRTHARRRTRAPQGNRSRPPLAQAHQPPPL